MTAALVYADQSARELSLNLVECAVDVAQFSVLRRGMLTGPVCKVDLGIIGASHFLIVEHEGMHFSEVFACTQLETDRRKLYYGSLGDSPKGAIEVPVFGELPYEFSYKVVSWEKGRGLYVEMSELAEANSANSLGLLFDFPDGSGKDQTQRARTSVSAMLRDAKVSTQTMHSYPNEGLLVFTKTTINFN